MLTQVIKHGMMGLCFDGALEPVAAKRGHEDVQLEQMAFLRISGRLL
jgi:hypothetical protein